LVPVAGSLKEPLLSKSFQVTDGPRVAVDCSVPPLIIQSTASTAFSRQDAPVPRFIHQGGSPLTGGVTKASSPKKSNTIFRLANSGNLPFRTVPS
jgi:hypothetical protein